jgi:hypothetical protein
MLPAKGSNMKTSARFLVHLLVCFVAPFFFLSFIVPATSAQTYNFGQATLPAGKQPRSIATGDLKMAFSTSLS